MRQPQAQVPFRYLCVVVKVNSAIGLVLSDGTWRFSALLPTDSKAGDLWLVEGYSAPGKPGAAPTLVRRITLAEEL